MYGTYRMITLQWCPYSFGKTVAIIPVWPILAIFLVVSGGIIILVGVGEVARSSSGTTTDDDFIKLNNNVMVMAYGAIGHALGYFALATNSLSAAGFNALPY